MYIEYVGSGGSLSAGNWDAGGGAYEVIFSPRRGDGMGIS